MELFNRVRWIVEFLTRGYKISSKSEIVNGVKTKFSFRHQIANHQIKNEKCSKFLIINSSITFNTQQLQTIYYA